MLQLNGNDRVSQIVRITGKKQHGLKYTFLLGESAVLQYSSRSRLILFSSSVNESAATVILICIVREHFRGSN